MSDVSFLFINNKNVYRDENERILQEVGGLRVRVSEGHVRQVFNPSSHGRADMNVDSHTHI